MIEVRINGKDYTFNVDFRYIKGMRGDGYLTPDDPDEVDIRSIHYKGVDITKFCRYYGIDEIIKEKIYETH